MFRPRLRFSLTFLFTLMVASAAALAILLYWQEARREALQRAAILKHHECQLCFEVIEWGKPSKDLYFPDQKRWGSIEGSTFIRLRYLETSRQGEEPIARESTFQLFQDSDGNWIVFDPKE